MEQGNREKQTCQKSHKQEQVEREKKSVDHRGKKRRGRRKKWKRHEPLPATYSTTARVFLLFLHLLEDGVFLDLDEVPAFLLAETKPEFLDAFAFLCRAGAPDLVGICLAFLIEEGCVPGLAGV